MTLGWPNLETAIADHKAGRLVEAEVAYRALLFVQPDNRKLLGLLGVVCHQTERWVEADNLLRRAIRFDPRNAIHYYNLGTGLTKMLRFVDAIEAFQTAISLSADFAVAHSGLATAYREIGEIDLAISSNQRALAMETNPKFASNLLYTLHFHPRFTSAMIASSHTTWRKTFAEPLRQFIQPHSNDRSETQRLRVGFVLPQLSDHPVTRFLLSYIENADFEQFELYCYSDKISQDLVANIASSKFSVIRKMSGMSDAQYADRVRDDRIDILVELSMHTSHNRLLVFSRKPAPVQVTYLAYAGTTGLDTIDYRLSDPHIDSPGGDESVYSEKTIRLETFWCYWRPPDAPEVGPPPVLATGSITFGSLNSYSKANTETLKLWSRVLHAVPNSRLMLYCPDTSARPRAERHLENNGIVPARLTFVGPMDPADYFARYAQIDIALDPFPYPGGTTTCDAVWMGVPVVTLPGSTAVSRGGQSILSNIGLTELIGATEDLYVQIATDLAGDRSRLTSLRSDLRSRMASSVLMDGPRFARRMEAAFREMWRVWCALQRRN